MGTLIIRAELSNPPSEILAFRSLTMITQEVELDNLIEIEQAYKDIYYHYMKRRGLMDFIEQIITLEENEFGLRIDYIPRYAPTILVEKITFRNLLSVAGQIKYWR